MSDSESLKKKQKMGDKENAMPVDDSSVGETGLDATALNRFSRQNAALGTYCLPAKLSSDTHVCRDSLKS